MRGEADPVGLCLGVEECIAESDAVAFVLSLSVAIGIVAAVIGASLVIIRACIGEPSPWLTRSAAGCLLFAAGAIVPVLVVGVI